MTWSGLRRAPALAIVALALSASGCGEDAQTAGLVIRFLDPDLKDQTRVVRVEIRRGGCDGTDVVYGEDVQIAGSPPSRQPGSLDEGTYGFSAEARNSDCIIIAANCQDIRLPAAGGQVIITLDSDTGAGSACAAGETCASGRCAMLPPADGGADSGGPVACTVEGEACDTGGICHGGECCLGCWDGSACVGGLVPQACGLAGEDCGVCNPGGLCRLGVCDAAGQHFDLTPVGSHVVDTMAAIYSAGSNGSAQRGRDPMGMLNDTFTQRTGTEQWVDVAGTQFTTCGITRTDGHLYCWGRNLLGAIGDPTVLDGDTSPDARRIQNIGDEVYQSIAAGNGHFCALRNTGRLFCWGDNRFGQTGTGVSSSAVSTPTEVTGGSTWTTVGRGVADHTCAIRTDGTLWCWGMNWRCDMVGMPVVERCTGGQLAQDTMSVQTTNQPLQVGMETDWEEVAQGVIHTCGIRRGGNLYCWGGFIEADGMAQMNGAQLGNGDRMGRADPTQVMVPMDGWTSVVAGEDHSCGLVLVGAELSAFCWGFGAWGQLGSGSTMDFPEPRMVTGGSGWTSLASGWTHTCGVRSGDLLCWGDRRQGQLGTGTAEGTGLSDPTMVTLEP